MSRLGKLLLGVVLLAGLPAQAGQEPELPLWKLVIVSGMAATHDGYDITDPELAFRKADGPDGSNYQIPGYVSIELHRYDHPLSIYTIRTATGDVINTFSCTLYRYPDLMQFRKERMKETGSPAVSPSQIDNNLSCLGIKIAPASTVSKKAGDTEQ